MKSFMSFIPTECHCCCFRIRLRHCWNICIVDLHRFSVCVQNEDSVLLNCCSFKGWVVCFKLNHNLLLHVYILNNSTFIYFGYIFSQSRRLMKYILRAEEFKVKDLYALFSSLKFNSLVSTGKNSIHLCNTEAY